MLITSLENERVKMYIKLKDRKYRKQTNTYIVEGEHLVLEAYKAGMVIEVILFRDEVLPIDAEKVYVTEEILGKITTMENAPSVMALCRIPEEKAYGNKLLLLDGIQDPGNLGTIIRSAVAFNIDTVILGKNTVDLYNPKTIRASQGMNFHITILEKDLIEIIKELKDKDIPVYGTDVNRGEDVRVLKEKDKESYALVMGNEGNGISEEIRELCDSMLYIKMNETAESLNVGVATSILLYELSR